MQRFSEEFRTQHPTPEVLDGIEGASGKLESLRRTRLYAPDLVPQFRGKGHLPFVPMKVLGLLQVAIRRALELADSMIRDANAYSYTPVWISSRSLFELSALIFDTMDRIRPILMKWDGEAYYQFCDHLDNILLGFKTPALQPEVPEGTQDTALKAKNILTMIDRLDRGAFQGIRRFYDELSEVAHPNYLGMIAEYQVVEDDRLTITFVDSPARRDLDVVRLPLNYAQLSLAMLAGAIDEYEQRFVDFVKICDANVPLPKERPSRPGPG